MVFSDKFADPASGWTTTGGRSYVSGGYQFAATGQSVVYAAAPYFNPTAQVSMSVTATTDGQSGGFGIVCIDATSTKGGMSYEFFALGDGTWLIEKRNNDNRQTPTALATGKAVATVGKAPVTVEAVCATLPGGKSVRLMLFINGHQSADVADQPAVLPSDGWVGGMCGAAPITLTASAFSLSNLDS